MLDLDPRGAFVDRGEADRDLRRIRPVAADVPQVREPAWRLERRHLAPIVLVAGRGPLVDAPADSALEHDIGKLDAYTSDPCAIDLTDLGRLQGEIALGYYHVRRLIEDLPGFPPELAAAVLHIILSHHGQLEHGSPVVPATREATLVHMIDNLGGRLGSFDRLEKALPDGSRWSGYDRALGGGAWFASRAA